MSLLITELLTVEQAKIQLRAEKERLLQIALDRVRIDTEYLRNGAEQETCEARIEWLEGYLTNPTWPVT